ncbi:hypothetical protein ASG57_32630 [Bradyrhizobium sp. Leaf396]|nr:hypothetical protein ASG57_32630 [Bradyrhizobium sp. Leaf396]
MSRSEVLRLRIEWCNTLAAVLPPTVRTALGDLVLQHLGDLDALQQRKLSRNPIADGLQQPVLMSGVANKRQSSPHFECPLLLVNEGAEQRAAGALILQFQLSRRLPSQNAETM